MRTFVNQEGSSNKFWTVEQTGTAYTATWGKIGTRGRELTKSFASDDACQNEVEKLIREKLSKGYVEVADVTKLQPKPTPDVGPMNEDVFWEMIASFNWSKTGNDDAVLRPAVNRLAAMPIEDIYRFADILSEKLFLLDGIAYASNIGEDAYKGEGEHFSVDCFLYARCCVVANGRQYFESVLADPNKMPKDLEFESLLYLPDTAYRKKTKTGQYDYSPKFDFETFSNVDGWRVNEPKRPWWKLW